MSTVLQVLIAWLVLACVAAPLLGRILRGKA